MTDSSPSAQTQQPTGPSTPAPPAVATPSAPDMRKVLTVVLLTGLLTGLATSIMKWGIKNTWILVTHDMHIDSSNPLFLALPVLGLMLAMVFQNYVMHEDLSHGTEMIKRDLKNGQYVLRPNLMFSSIFGCSLTIALGGSAGSEGPSAATGAAIASNLSRWLHLDEKWLRLMLGIGAGAGISGIFKSPVGGVLFTLEVLKLELSTIPVIILVACCLISSCTAWALGGFAFDLKFVDYMPFDPYNFMWMSLLGVFCGIYSLYYNYTRSLAKRGLSLISNPWLRAIAGGVALSGAIFLFPALYGEGYGIIGDIVNMHGTALLNYSPFHSGLSIPALLMLVTVCMLLLKGALVAATIEGGGVAGTFTPTLFAGCLVGYLFGVAMNHWFGMHLPAENFALLGMAGVMSGTIKAPLMAIFITAEMSNSYQFMCGFLIVSVFSYGVVYLFSSKENKNHPWPTLQKR